MKYLFILLPFLIASCVAQKQKTRIAGKYHSQGSDLSNSLNLQNNGRFNYNIESFEVNSGCPGEWRFTARDTIELHCDTVTDVLKYLESGFMSERTKKAIVINKDSLMMDGVILTKQNK